MLSEIRVFLVDDHDLVRSGIKRILSGTSDIQVIGEASSGEEALARISELKPNIVLMDLKMPVMDGIETAKALIGDDPNLKVLIVSVCLDEKLLSKIFQIGASGFVTKSSSADEMVKAIRLVTRGQRYVSPAFVQQLSLRSNHCEAVQTSFDVLSERELQVALMIIEGQTIQLISKRLGINRKTINSYRSRTFQKLDVKNDIELTLLAIRQGLVSSLVTEY